MPTYAYECQDCGHRFEEFQSITAAPLRKCPSCCRLKLQRLIGPGAAVIFKGGGFYETDYRSKSYRAGEKAEADSSQKDLKDQKDQSSGDAGKPAPKPADKKKTGGS